MSPPLGVRDRPRIMYIALESTSYSITFLWHGKTLIRKGWNANLESHAFAPVPNQNIRLGMGGVKGT